MFLLLLICVVFCSQMNVVVGLLSLLFLSATSTRLIMCVICYAYLCESYFVPVQCFSRVYAIALLWTFCMNVHASYSFNVISSKGRGISEIWDQCVDIYIVNMQIVLTDSTNVMFFRIIQISAILSCPYDISSVDYCSLCVPSVQYLGRMFGIVAFALILFISNTCIFILCVRSMCILEILFCRCTQRLPSLEN